MQTLSILTEQNVRLSLQELRPQDVLIEPALGDFSASDFDNLLKAVPFGEAAARTPRRACARWRCRRPNLRSCASASFG